MLEYADKGIQVDLAPSYVDAIVGPDRPRNCLDKLYDAVGSSLETRAVPMTVLTDSEGNSNLFLDLTDNQAALEICKHILDHHTTHASTKYKVNALTLTEAATNTDNDASTYLTVGVNTDTAATIDQGTNTPVTVLIDQGTNTDEPVFMDRASGPEQLMDTSDSVEADTRLLPSNSAEVPVTDIIEIDDLGLINEDLMILSDVVDVVTSVF